MLLSNEDLEDWILRQSHVCVTALMRAISLQLILTERDRPSARLWRPAAGSILASPAIADWNPEPDYFFHWIRDSAIVMRTVVERLQDATSEDERSRWRGLFDDFVSFSLALSRLDGAEWLRRVDRPAVQPEARPICAARRRDPRARGGQSARRAALQSRRLARHFAVVAPAI